MRPLVLIGQRCLLHSREYDKRQHFSYSFVLMLLFAFFTGLIGAFIAVALIGLAKEVWDHFYGSGFCWIDMAANSLGMGVAAAFVRTLQYFL